MHRLITVHSHTYYMSNKISPFYSAEQLIDRQKTTAKKRRRNQNAEIDELASLLPVKHVPSASLSIGGALEFDGLEGSADKGKTLPVDKISVLRIVSTFLKFQDFVKHGHLRKSINGCFLFVIFLKDVRKLVSCGLRCVILIPIFVYINIYDIIFVYSGTTHDTVGTSTVSLIQR